MGKTTVCSIDFWDIQWFSNDSAVLWKIQAVLKVVCYKSWKKRCSLFPPVEMLLFFIFHCHYYILVCFPNCPPGCNGGRPCSNGCGGTCGCTGEMICGEDLFCGESLLVKVFQRTSQVIKGISLLTKIFDPKIFIEFLTFSGHHLTIP